MQTETLAGHVREYVAFTRELYPSREWMNVRAALAKLIAECDELTVRKVRHALDCLTLNVELTPNYRRKCWARWQRFLRWCVEHEHAHVELLVHTSSWRPRFPRGAARSERSNPVVARKPLVFSDIWAAVPFMPQPCRDVVTLLTLTGARPSEITNLLTRDFDTQHWVAVLTQHKSAHHGLLRELAFPHDAIPLLEQRLRPFTPLDPLFPAPKDVTRCVTVQTVGQQLRRTLLRHKELRLFQLYDIRRLCARTVRAAASLDHAQALLGHANARTTEIYAPRRDDIARSAVEILAREASQ